MIRIFNDFLNFWIKIYISGLKFWSNKAFVRFLFIFFLFYCSNVIFHFLKISFISISRGDKLREAFNDVSGNFDVSIFEPGYNFTLNFSIDNLYMLIPTLIICISYIVYTYKKWNINESDSYISL